MEDAKRELKKTNLFDRIWIFFSSITLTFILLITLALTSIIGTVIEQQAEPAKNLRLLAKIFGESLAPTVFDLFMRIGFMDMYHSWWFVTLLFLLSTNLIICSLNRFPHVWKQINTPQSPLDENILRSIAHKMEITFKGQMAETSKKIVKILKKNGYNLSEKKVDGAIHLYSQKGRYSRLGVYITHLSVIILFIGVIIGALFGFKGFLNLPEGMSSDKVYLRDRREMPLNFTIKCEKFDIEYYGDSDMPKDYKSDLVILRDGREVMRKTIEVNDPFTFEGITFYQSSYGYIPELEGKIMLKVFPRGEGSPNRDLTLKVGDSFDIPEADISVKILGFNHAFAIDQMGRVFAYSEQMVNPAIYIGVSKGGKTLYSGWILKRYPQTGKLPEGPFINFYSYWGAQYTGLQVKKDPGTWVVYVGCGIMTIGLFIAFFTYHKKIWVRLKEEKGVLRVTLAGTCSKNKLAFEREFKKLASLIEKV
ncbi:MAG: cytochrome c biogenesis protein ResB [Nitrospirota bacterium]